MKDTGQALLTTTGLTVGYQSGRHQNRLFEDLNLSVKAGSMVCFMGPNGAGKSTLLRTLAGLQEPLAGMVQFPTRRPPDNRSRLVAVVLTDRITAVNLTVGEILSFGRYPYLGWDVRLTREDERLIRNAVDSVRLHPLLNKKIYELSDGQMQLVMIARALAQDTPVILLDEPTAHLDLNNRVEIMNLLRDLARATGKGILLATHELDLALQTSDIIWLTGKNKNILTGLPEDLVLNGSFDEIFALKGFDLKTGKVLHTPFREVVISLTGSGAPYLWTKNALERNGFGVSGDERPVGVQVIERPEGIRWIVTINDEHIEADSIRTVIDLL